MFYDLVNAQGIKAGSYDRQCSLFMLTEIDIAATEDEQLISDTTILTIEEEVPFPPISMEKYWDEYSWEVTPFSQMPDVFSSRLARTLEKVATIV